MRHFMLTSPVLILFLAYQDHQLGLLYYLSLTDAYSRDKTNVYQ